MKAVAYSIKPFEKEFLAKANQKKHDITLISNPLNLDTAAYAAGKDAVIVFTNDDVSAKVIDRLASLGIKYIVTRSAGIDHIDKEAASRYQIKLSNAPSYSPSAIAEHTVAMAFALNRRLIKANQNVHHFDFRNDELIGFNFTGKTVGIIGLGQTGRSVAAIFNSLGCTVIGYDDASIGGPGIKPVSLDKLLQTSDIISLHIPLSEDTRHFIREETLSKMKPGVMLINSARGALIKTVDILAALESGRIGYLGLDVYEYEKGLFFENHKNDLIRDPLLQQLLNRDNVLITPHQAYLTREALQEIADQTIRNLDLWQQNKCVGNACICNKDCRSVNNQVKPAM
jgi:D-lactate dehydrogenase